MLSMLRPHLPAQRGAGGVRGSLRWLEEAMRASGANPAAVRNIIYKDVGLPADMQALYAILSRLYAEAGLSAPPLQLPASVPADLELLGRSKKRAYRTFLSGILAGRTPKLMVAGKAGVGKTLLIEHLERELSRQVPALRLTRLLLGEDISAALGSGDGGHPNLPFALQAEQQARAAQQFLQGCVAGGRGALLIRVSGSGPLGGRQFGGLPLRGHDAELVSSAAWAAEHLLRRAPEGLAVLLALEEASDLPPDLRAEVIHLAQPSSAEARRYLMSTLSVDAARADELVRQTGRHLDRLTLLVSAKRGQPVAAKLLADPQAARLLAALQVAQGPVGVSAPRPILEAALGQPLESLPPYLRTLLDEVNPAEPRPISPSLLAETSAQQDPAVLRQTWQRLAAAARLRPEWAEWELRALTELRDWPALRAWFESHPDLAALAAPLWSRVRQSAPPPARQAVARWVVTYQATLGRYDHPQARDALFTLLEAEESGPRLWARIKLAESSLDAGQFEAAAAQLAHPEVRAALDRSSSLDAWHAEAQADALLVEAALKRWQGDLSAATAFVEDPRTDSSGARATLWRGLIAKDAGRWADALSLLMSVPPTSPLLFARARAQEGDLRLRLGQVAAALSALNDASARLQLGGASPQERARTEARAATALRRSGHVLAALERSRAAQALTAQALTTQPYTAVQPSADQADPVLQARLVSESIPLHLALGQWPEALGAAARALALLAEPNARQAEAAYRTRRTEYRAALIYLSRGLGLPYLHPFRGPGPEGDNADLRRARQILDALLSAAHGLSDREQVLAFDMRLSRVLCEPDAAAALNFAKLALELTDHPYAEAQARATLAEALLRGEQIGAALGEINRAHALLRRVAPSGTTDTDPGLHAQLLTLEARAGLLEGPAGARTALTWLQVALTEAHLAPFRVGVWREVGRLLEGVAGGEALALRLWPQLGLPQFDLGVWRLADALPLALAPEPKADPLDSAP
ncbi:hypothetical protein FNU79_15390 [Deinococcus detaillensis]|uniref:Uncharacterized protein n=2 Tax=Deinococcus detaillensis TaxID=2592048 RepID=A0A553UMJ0_9DEIO|nr:hypothetical protein FNU79_15390 [Deinococcus detaillensis]